MSRSKTAQKAKGIDGSVFAPGLIANFEDDITLYAHNGDELMLIGKFDRISEALSALDRVDSSN